MKALVSKEARKIWVVSEERDFATHLGTINSSQLNARSGSKVVAKDTGKIFFVFKPGWSDLFSKIKRLPQIMPKKDVGLIIAETGIGKESLVVDGGTGSGALACSLARIARKVVTYETKPECISLARENAELLKLKNLVVKQKDMTKGIDERNVDLITLDLPEPWLVLEHASKALKPGGWLASYSPQITQVQQFVEELLKREEFLHFKSVEVIERAWRVEGRIVRPESIAIAHSGFITFARKLTK